ncbi:MAG: tetratricopeptide repeat protein [Bacteroidales bacterium]|jgi:tetratricopeptide (TPR) repeat protein
MKTNIQKSKPQQSKKKGGNKLIVPEKKNSSVLQLIIVFCLPVLLYLQTINFGFTDFDDNLIIKDNITFLSHIRNASHAFLTDAFIGKSNSFYRPLQTISYMVDIQLSGGNNPWMYHLSNIMLLGLISCLLFLLLRRLLIPPKLAILGTLIYCAHPLFVSTIAYLPTRGDLLLTVFSLLSFLFLIEFLQKKKIIYLFIHWVSFSIALFCKETAAFLPFLFIIYYFAFSAEKRFEKKYLFIVLLYAVSGIFWFWLRSKAIGGIVSNQNYTIELIPILTNLRTIPESLTKLFLLIGITPIPGFTILKTLTGFVIIAIIVVIFFRKRKVAKRRIIFCFSWFLILMLPPMLYKHPHIEYLDHRFFLPLIGILLFLLFIFPKKWLLKGDIKRSWLLIAVLIFLSSFTFIKSRSYSDPLIFYNSAISQNPNSALAYYNRGIFKKDKSNFQEAIEDYNKAIAICPTYVEAYFNRGIANTSIGNSQKAIEDYNKAVSINPNLTEAYYNRGNIKLEMGDKPGAIEDYNKAISINPNYAKAYNNRGIANYSLGNFQSAVEDCNNAIAVNANYAEAYNNRGIANYNLGNIKSAIEDYNKAIAITPNFSDAYYNRGFAKFKLIDLSGAIEDCEKVLQLNPNDETALNLKTTAQQELQKISH